MKEPTIKCGASAHAVDGNSLETSCRNCGDVPTTRQPGKFLFGYQRPTNPERRRLLSQLRRERWFAKQKCECGKPSVCRLYGDFVCRNCQIKELSLRHHNAVKNKQDKQREYKKQWYKRRIASGLCAKCGKPRNKHGWYCDDCHPIELKRINSSKYKTRATGRYRCVDVYGRRKIY